MFNGEDTYDFFLLKKIIFGHFVSEFNVEMNIKTNENANFSR